MVTLFAAFAVALTTFFVSDRASTPAPQGAGCLAGSERPCSANVEMGKTYRFQVLHCGLTWVVDFDQSFWDIDEKTMTADEEQRFGINSDEGTITLTSANIAVYRSARGGEATLRRHEGPKTFFLCA